jgi:hypothetical protein
MQNQYRTILFGYRGDDMNEELFRLAQELESAQTKYLNDNGWVYTCEVPGSFWLWSKKLDDGRVILVQKDDALKMEEHLPKPKVPVSGK